MNYKYFYEYIFDTLPRGSTILELGSGAVTGKLAALYTMYSVEHSKKWLNKYDTTYIYAPIKKYPIPKFDGQNQWYHYTVLQKELPKSYDLILIDGPPGNIGRGGFYKYLDLFDTSVPMVFDDVDRTPEAKLINIVASKLNRPYTVYTLGPSKLAGHFGVIEP